MTSVSDTSPALRQAAPRSANGGRLLRVFGLLGGPVAWFALVCLGYAFASGGCFRGPTPQRATWTWIALIVLLILGAVVALAASLVSLRQLRSTPVVAETARRELIAGGSGGRHFIALWGAVLGAGALVATLMCVAAYVALPQCWR